MNLELSQIVGIVGLLIACVGGYFSIKKFWGKNSKKNGRRSGR